MSHDILDEQMKRDNPSLKDHYSMDSKLLTLEKTFFDGMVDMFKSLLIFTWLKLAALFQNNKGFFSKKPLQETFKVGLKSIFKCFCLTVMISRRFDTVFLLGEMKSPEMILPSRQEWHVILPKWWWCLLKHEQNLRTHARKLVTLSPLAPSNKSWH